MIKHDNEWVMQWHVKLTHINCSVPPLPPVPWTMSTVCCFLSTRLLLDDCLRLPYTCLSGHGSLVCCSCRLLVIMCVEMAMISWLFALFRRLMCGVQFVCVHYYLVLDSGQCLGFYNLLCLFLLWRPNKQKSGFWFIKM